MLALGVLDENGGGPTFTSDAGGPVLPGKDASSLRSAQRRRQTPEAVRAAVVEGAELARDRASRIAAASMSSITLAALAQTHAVLGEVDQALSAARAALRLSLTEAEPAEERPRVIDAHSAGVAVQIMTRFGQAAEAFASLQTASLPYSLRLTAVAVAVELDRPEEAWAILEGTDGELVKSFRGFLLAARGDYREAISQLRAALRDDPNDAEAAVNLSVSFWQIGARGKAIATALRATRVAPGRRDLSLHYLELLLAAGEVSKAASEIDALKQRKVVSDSRFLVLQARVALEKDEPPRALPLLEKALAEASTEGNDQLRVEIAANLAVLANTVSRSSEAPDLRRAIEALAATTTPARRAFLAHQLAWLDADNDRAGDAAAEWFAHEPANPRAAAAALVAVGIGQERWSDAAAIADAAVARFPTDSAVVNNGAYILAMAGRAEEAIRHLAPLADSEFVARATLGLAYLANGEVDRGMRLYREAGKAAEKADSSWHSLMTAYQALVVRQLGLHKSEAPEVISALSLAPMPLPSDWEDQPDFMRLYRVSEKHGYGWPLAL
jgi:tetratricopeptide (TPR) repeat protein